MPVSPAGAMLASSSGISSFFAAFSQVPPWLFASNKAVTLIASTSMAFSNSFWLMKSIAWRMVMASLRSRTSFSPAAPVVMNSVISTSLNWDVFTMPPLINFWRMALMKLAVKAPGCLAAKSGGLSASWISWCPPSPLRLRSPLGSSPWISSAR